MHPFLETYTALIPDDPPPPAAMTKLLDIGPLASTPKSGAQASAMVTTGCHPLAASIKYHGGLTPANLKHCKVWLAERLRWCWNGDATLKSGPAKFATNPDGTLQKNDSGDWIQIQKWDASHADFDLNLIIAAATGEPLPLEMANDIIEEMEFKGEFSPKMMDGNTRRHTRLLRATISFWAATHDPRALVWIKIIINRLSLMMLKQGTAPYLTVNENEVKDTLGDHKGCGCCTYMQVIGAQALDELEHYLGKLSPVAEQVRMVARDSGLYALKHPAVTTPHTLLADYNPVEGPVNYFVGNGMDRHNMLGLAPVAEAEIGDWYMTADWTKSSDKNYMNHHNFGISSRLAKKYGWRP